MFGLALASACGDNRDDPATGPASTSAFTVTAAPNALRISPGGAGLSIVTARGGQPPIVVMVGSVPNGVSIRVASTELANAFKLIITTDASVAVGTYAIGVRCTSSDKRPEVTTQVTLTVASP